MGGRSNLSGKNIVLIGCGTIGSFLAQQLAQSGAGAAGGKLVLVDHDKLKTGNLGRHLLGTPYLDRPKAEGCRDFLRDQLPMLNIEFRNIDAAASDWTTTGFDLVIDATGEEGFSIAVNERSVKARPVGPPFSSGCSETVQRLNRC
jgi:tRNA A37 threonylcarbamoyladenosine dehydratase